MSICGICLNRDKKNYSCAIPHEARYRKNYRLNDEQLDFAYTENKPLSYCYFFIEEVDNANNQK
jgi:hypothetical protein